MFNGELEEIHVVLVVISGSLWDPNITTALSVDREHKRLYVIVVFATAQYSQRYQVSIQSHLFHCSENVFKVCN